MESIQEQRKKDFSNAPLPPTTNIPPMTDTQTIYLLQNKKYHQVHTKDIAYLKPAPGGAICVLSDGEIYDSELSMKDSLKQLPVHSFMQVHKSYVINLQHLTSIDLETRKIILCKKNEIGISIKRMRLLVEKLQFLRKKDNR